MGILNRILKLKNKVSRAYKAGVDEINKPDSFAKGDDFENYVRKYIFPQDKYVVKRRTGSYQANKDDYIESTLDPDFLFRCKETGKEFYVEAKFRGNLFNGKIEWCKQHQFKRYQEKNKEKPVFICLGFLGTPKSPKHIYIIPISKIQYTGLFPSFVKDYAFYLKKPIFSSYLWKL